MGGFGSTTTTPFKPFGATTTTPGFGTTPGATATPFGGGGFGAGQSSAFGGPQVPPNTGTTQPPFSVHQERDTNNNMLHFQTISAMPAYRAFSLEELRWSDYQAGRKTSQSAGGFGVSTGFGQPAVAGFGTAQPVAATTGFGGFGSTTTQSKPFGTTSLFGQPQQTSLFGQQQTQQSTSLFGQPQPQQPQTSGFGATTSLFGQKPATSTTTGVGGFGQAPSTTATSTFGGFGTTQPAQQQGSTGFGGFGQTTTQPAQPSTFSFGKCLN